MYFDTASYFNFVKFYSTLPFIVSVFTGVLVFDFTINDLVNGPFVAALYVTLIFPLSPGFTGVLEKSATEQPHEGATSEMIIGDLPAFVKANSCDTGLL